MLNIRMGAWQRDGAILDDIGPVGVTVNEYRPSARSLNQIGGAPVGAMIDDNRPSAR